MPTRETDSDSGKGTMTSYGSVNSLNTNDGSQTASTPMDNPELLKKQKACMDDFAHLSINIIPNTL